MKALLVVEEEIKALAIGKARSKCWGFIFVAGTTGIKIEEESAASSLMFEECVHN